MVVYSKELSIRWADLDPNFHLRHTAYYDFAAQSRIDLLTSIGLTVHFMQQEEFGPVFFLEECIFRRNPVWRYSAANKQFEESPSRFLQI